MAEGGPEYITGGLESSFVEILAGMFADYQARMPGWRPNPGASEVVIMETVALRHGVRLDTDSQVLAAIFTYFGSSVASVPFKAATPATVDATVTISADFLTEEHTIPAGLRVSLEGPEEQPVFFEVLNEVPVAVGEETASVTLIAQEPGAGASGLSGTVTIVDPRAWIDGVTLTSETAGGEDAESEPDYRNRLVAKERRDSPTIITAVDAQEAILEIPGVGRCLILDNYVPKIGEEAPKEGVPGAFTAVISDAEGANVSGAIKAEALALVNSERLLDLQGYVIDPTRTDVTCEYHFTTYPGFESAAVKAAGDAAVAAYFSNATWGFVPGPAGGRDWEDELLVRYSELYAVLNAVEGLNHVTLLKINGSADKNATLTAPGALPTLTSITSVAE
jgi:hypothetical protein